MPRIPKIKPRAIHLTDFPQPMYRSATGEYNRYNPIYASAVKDDLGLEMVQGPDLPWAIENRRQAIKAAQERLDAKMADERARQAYNRRVQAWNEYIELPYRDRLWYANERGIKGYLGPEMYGYPEEELARIKTLPQLESYLRTKREDMWPRHYDFQDLEPYERFDEFPDWLADEAPWRY